MITVNQRKSNPVLAIPIVLLGVGATASAIFISELQMGNAALLLVGLGLSVSTLYFASKESLTYIMLVLLALGIPFNLDLNLFLRKHVGVASIDIGLSFLSSLALGVLFLYDHYSTRSLRPLFRYNRALFWAPIFYIMCGILSFYNASSSELVVLELVRLGMLFIILFIVMNLQNRRQINIFVIALSVGVILQTLISLYQYKTGALLGLGVLGETLMIKEEAVGMARAAGTLGHGNILAYYFEILIPFMFAIFLVEKRVWFKFWFLIVVLLGLLGIVTTQSRGGWVSVPISLTLTFVVLMRGRIFNRKAAVGLFFGCLGFVIFFLSVYPTIERRITGPDYGSAAARPPLNRAAMSLIEQYPVFGVGLNNMAIVFKTYDKTGGSSVFRRGVHVVHNMYLGVWADTGTLGLLAFLGMFVTTFVVTAKTLFKVPLWQQGILVGAAAGLLAHLIHGFVDPGFRISMSVSMLVYTMFGMVGAMSVLSRNESGKSGEDRSIA